MGERVAFPWSEDRCCVPVYYRAVYAEALDVSEDDDELDWNIETYSDAYAVAACHLVGWSAEKSRLSECQTPQPPATTSTSCSLLLPSCSLS